MFFKITRAQIYVHVLVHVHLLNAHVHVLLFTVEHWPTNLVVAGSNVVQGNFPFQYCLLCICMYRHVHVRFGPSQLSCLGTCSSVGRALCLEYKSVVGSSPT